MISLVQDSRFSEGSGLGSRVKCAWFMVYGLWFMVYGLWFGMKAKGLGFRV